MKHLASPRFWRHYRELPESVRKLADKNFQLLKTDPYHPSLHFKRIDRVWSVRVLTIARLGWTRRTQLFGFGSVLTLTTTSSSSRCRPTNRWTGATGSVFHIIIGPARLLGNGSSS